MKKTLLLSAAAAAMMMAQHSFAGEIFITGRFDPSYAAGYVDTSFDSEFGDTSGDVYGDAVYFSNSALLPFPKTIELVDTPAYGTVFETFTALATLAFTPAGEFYQLVGPTGWLDVDIVYPGHGISSFSFVDYGVTAPPPVDPPPIDPPSCVLNCGGDPPPVVIPGAPEPSTWLMMLIGFAGLGFFKWKRESWKRTLARVSPRPIIGKAGSSTTPMIPAGRPTAA